MSCRWKSIFSIVVYGCLGALLEGAETVAIAQYDFEARYPVETGEQQIFPSEKMPLLREKADVYLVERVVGDGVHVVAIRKYDESGRRLAYEQAGIVQVTTTYFEDFGQGYILIARGKRYAVLKGTDQSKEITIRCGLAQGSIPITVPRNLFTVHSTQALEAQEQAREAARNERISKRAVQLGDFQEGSYTLTSKSVLRDAYSELNDQFKRWQLAADMTAKDNVSAKVERFLRDPMDALCHIRSTSGRGTGFLMSMDDRVYVVTNIHVVLSREPFEIITTNGEQLDVLKVELATDRDLARISVRGPARALPSSNYVNMGDSIIAYGDSEGAGVMTGEPGEILGLSHTDLEISANVVRGNSGGPIVKSGNTVVGVVSRAEGHGLNGDWVKEGTRYAEVRRFGVRISDDIRWKPIHPEALVCINEHLDDIYQGWAAQSYNSILEQYLKNPMSLLPDIDTGNPGLNSWKQQHNTLVAEHREKMALPGRLEDKLQWLDSMRNRSHAMANGLNLTARKNAAALDALEILPKVEFIESLRHQQIRFWESQSNEIKTHLPRVHQRIDAYIDAEMEEVQKRLKRKQSVYRR